MLGLNSSNFSFFFDLINLSIISLIIFISYKHKISNKYGAFVLLLFASTPLFGNNVIFDLNVFPDQSKYIINTILIRENYFQIVNEIISQDWEQFHNRFNLALSDQYIPTRYASLLIASIPIPFIETVRSIGFFSKFIFIVWFIYIISNQKKFFEKKDYSYYLLLFLPSVLIYSSIALKEIYIFVFFHLCMFFVLMRKPFFFMISIFMLALVRVELILLIIFFLLSYAFLFYSLPEKKFSNFFQNLVKIIIVSSILLVLYYQSNLNLSLDLFFEKINQMKSGYYHEGDLSIKLNTYQIGSYNLLPITLDLFKSIMSPLFSKSTNLFLQILIIENFIILLLFFYFSYKISLNNKLKTIFYFIFFIIIHLSVGTIVINDMAIYRYKITMLIPLILIMKEELKIKNENIIFNKS